ncbi:hypothetical protein CRENBAI_002005 [Crenichthys baileyi]|uniref:Uncharacterized protein n=1 Tax=Crenichthys baileyi TaxID=28760 RepID=A0AAV9SMK6_9TELE
MSHVNTHMLTSYREPLLNPPPPSSPSLFVFLMLALSRSNIGVFLTVNFSLSISFTQHLFSSFFLPFHFSPSSLLFLSSLLPRGKTDSHIILDVYRLDGVTAHIVF